MARRKSAAAQLYGAYKKRKQVKEQAERRAQRELDQWEQQLREAEQEENRQRRQAEQAERDARRREQEKERAGKQQADEARRAEGQRRQEKAERQRAAVAARVAELGGILTARPSELGTYRMALEQAFEAEGSVALAALVEQALAGSPYPAGFPRVGKVMCAPESRELLINYDLPGQDVVPAVAEYKVVRGRDGIQPVPRKDAEIKKLYADVLARTALRTLDEVFQVTPVALVDGISPQCLRGLGGPGDRPAVPSAADQRQRHAGTVRGLQLGCSRTRPGAVLAETERHRLAPSI